MDNDKVIIRIKLDSVWVRLVLLTLVVLALTGSVAWALDESEQGSAGTYAPLQQGAGGRGFYLTPDDTKYQGNEALTACAAGYHMASLWEIFDLSNLTYDTTQGITGADSGEGPTTGLVGWVRTGYHTAEVTQTAGVGNCLAWTSNSPTEHGTIVALSFGWTQQGIAVSPWEPVDDIPWTACDTENRVWCVED